MFDYSSSPDQKKRAKQVLKEPSKRSKNGQEFKSQKRKKLNPSERSDREESDSLTIEDDYLSESEIS